MKQGIRKVIYVRLLGIYIMGAALSYSICTDDYMAFDDPYPATPFRSLLATCAQMWQLYDCLIQEPHDAPPIVTDAIIGCSIRFHEEVVLFLQQEQRERSMYHEDIAYLAHVVEQLVHMQDQTPERPTLHHSARTHLIYILNACKDHQARAQE